MRILIILLVVLHSQSVYADDIENSLSVNLANELLTTLPGTWDGQAIETPVGPVAYSINFHRCGEDIVAGVANPGAALHYWRFWQSDGELRLTFLTTFRGNQEPTPLVANRAETRTIWFYAPELALLTVSITLDDPQVDIRIFHHDKPHVYIRLIRTDKTMTESDLEAGLVKSCKKLTPP